MPFSLTHLFSQAQRVTLFPSASLLSLQSANAFYKIASSVVSSCVSITSFFPRRSLLPSFPSLAPLISLPLPLLFVSPTSFCQLFFNFLFPSLAHSSSLHFHHLLSFSFVLPSLDSPTHFFFTYSKTWPIESISVVRFATGRSATERACAAIIEHSTSTAAKTHAMKIEEEEK